MGSPLGGYQPWVSAGLANTYQHGDQKEAWLGEPPPGFGWRGGGMDCSHPPSNLNCPPAKFVFDPLGEGGSPARVPPYSHFGPVRRSPARPLAAGWRSSRRWSSTRPTCCWIPRPAPPSATSSGQRRVQETFLRIFFVISTFIPVVGGGGFGRAKFGCENGY